MGASIHFCCKLAIVELLFVPIVIGRLFRFILYVCQSVNHYSQFAAVMEIDVIPAVKQSLIISAL